DVALQEWLAREIKLEVHPVKPHLARGELVVLDHERAPLDQEGQGRLAGGGRCHPLVTAGRVGGRSGGFAARVAVGLVEHRKERGEAYAPAIDGVIAPWRGEAARRCEIAAAARGVRRQVVVLDARRDALGADTIERRKGVIDAIEAEEVVGRGE